MAICRADYELFKKIHSLGGTASRSLLELGEAEVYGDVPFQEMLADVKAHGTRDDFRMAAGLIAGARAGDVKTLAWGMAKILYRTFLGCEESTAIDLHGSEESWKLDLNHAADCYMAAGPYDVTFNTGTAEHVFMVGNVLKFAHNMAKLGGLMVHCFPFSGLVDHGFYNVNPTLITSLARANSYEILWMTLSVIDGPLTWLNPATAPVDLRSMARDRTLPENAWLHVVYRKTTDAPFEIPRQAIYAENPDPVLIEEWMKCR